MSFELAPTHFLGVRSLLEKSVPARSTYICSASQFDWASQRTLVAHELPGAPQIFCNGNSCLTIKFSEARSHQRSLPRYAANLETAIHSALQAGSPGAMAEEVQHDPRASAAVLDGRRSTQGRQDEKVGRIVPAAAYFRQASLDEQSPSQGFAASSPKLKLADPALVIDDETILASTRFIDALDSSKRTRLCLATSHRPSSGRRDHTCAKGSRVSRHRESRLYSRRI